MCFEEEYPLFRHISRSTNSRTNFLNRNNCDGLQRTHRQGCRKYRTPDFAVNLKNSPTEGGKYRWWKIRRRSTGCKATRNWFTFFWRRERKGENYSERFIMKSVQAQKIPISIIRRKMVSGNFPSHVQTGNKLSSWITGAIPSITCDALFWAETLFKWLL